MYVEDMQTTMNSHGGGKTTVTISAPWNGMMNAYQTSGGGSTGGSAQGTSVVTGNGQYAIAYPYGGAGGASYASPAIITDGFYGMLSTDSRDPETFGCEKTECPIHPLCKNLQANINTLNSIKNVKDIATHCYNCEHHKKKDMSHELQFMMTKKILTEISDQEPIKDKPIHSVNQGHQHIVMNPGWSSGQAVTTTTLATSVGYQTPIDTTDGTNYYANVDASIQWIPPMKKKK